MTYRLPTGQFTPNQKAYLLAWNILIRKVNDLFLPMGYHVTAADPDIRLVPMDPRNTQHINLPVAIAIELVRRFKGHKRGDQWETPSASLN
jgi:hypothetical protein